MWRLKMRFSCDTLITKLSFDFQITFISKCLSIFSIIFAKQTD